MIKTCPLCQSELVLDDHVLFCSECFHVVDRHYYNDEKADEIRKYRSRGLSWFKVGEAVNMTAMGARKKFIAAFGRNHPLLKEIEDDKRRKETTILAYILHEDGASYAEVAKLLNIGVSSCKQKVRRERKRKCQQTD